MKKMLRPIRIIGFLKECLVLPFIIGLCLISQSSHSQIINEGFEENEWRLLTNSTSGQVVITATSASSTNTYFVHPATTSSTFTTNGPFTPNASYTTFVGSTSTTGGNSTRTTYGVHYTSTGINTSPNSGTWWYSRGTTYNETRGLNRGHSMYSSFQLATSGYIATPVTNGAVVSITFWAAPQGALVAGLNTNTNAAQPTYSSNGTATMGNFTYQTQSYPASGTAGNSSMQSFVYTGSFTGACRFGIFNASSSSIYIDDIVISGPSGTPPSVTTDLITAGQNTATINGTVTPGTMPLLYSGVIWSTSNTPMDTSVSTKTRNNPSATGAFANIATGLIPGNNIYYGRAYVISLDGKSYYGIIRQFQTNPATAPTLTTVPVTNVLSNKASSGGANIDSGGVSILQKGVCWAVAPAVPVIGTASTMTNDGSNGNNYASIAKILTPNTLYNIRAYATNSVGTGYGNQLQFTTGSPVPVLVATPATLNLGTVNFGTASPVLSYNLSGSYLIPASGTITVTAPAGFYISTSPNGGFAATINISYSASTLNLPVYVQLVTTSYGFFTGSITHTGGGTTPQDADAVNVLGSVVQNPNVLTNQGTDFWTGFGYQERMRQGGDSIASSSNNAALLSLYIAAIDQDAIVSVELPGITGIPNFPKNNILIPKGTVREIKNFPIGDNNDELNPGNKPDIRLYYTGISKRAIHVYSTNGVPVAVWMHSYANNNSAAAAMLFPTNTWNSSYTVQAYGNEKSNNVNNNSFFFVVANEDNTPIWFTPSNDIIDSSAATLFDDGHTAANVKYPKNVPQGPIYLNKGQVFNAMGFLQGSGSNNAVGLDLSGSTVKTDCGKRIAVFGGNGRILVNASNCNTTSGSDHMIQQMFPKVAWGTKYIAVPTKTMEYNMYRINVDNPATKVWVNDPNHINPPLTGIINNLYYQIQTNQVSLIESDKPISVTQFLVTGGCAQSNGSKGLGDPEMIILSPVQQAINKTTVYSAFLKDEDAVNGTNKNGHYINVVIKKEGINSFRLDNKIVADTGINQALVGTATQDAYKYSNYANPMPIAQAFIKFPIDTNYYYAKFRVDSGKSHSLYSDYPFNAIAYGMGDGESYGYNAGTAIKDLSVVVNTETPFGGAGTATTCKGNTTRVKISLPYDPLQVTSIAWNLGTNASISPNGTTTDNSPTPVGTQVVDGQTFYTYNSPTQYTFNDVGSFPIAITITGTFANDCGSSITTNFNMTVVRDTADFSFAPITCGSTQINFTDATHTYPGDTTKQWQWDFGTGLGTANTQNPTYTFPANTVYQVKLRTINNIGCFADTTKTVDLTNGLVAKFGVKDTICAKTSVLFTDTSGGGTIVKWMYDFGDGTKDTVYTNAPVPHVFQNAGSFTVSLKVETATGCTATFTKTITVRAVPVASFNMPAGICLPSGLTQFTNNSTISDGQTLTHSWNFGDPGSGSNNISTALSPSHTYSSTGPFNINLVVTSQYGCTDDSLRTLSSVYPQPTAAISAPTSACMKDSVQFNDGSTAGTGNTVTEWAWAFGDGGTSTIQNPKHAYNTTVGSPFNVTLTVKSDKGCTSNPVTHTITINPIPNVVFNAIPNICQNIASMPITQASETTGIAGASPSWVYTGTAVTGSNFSPSTAGAGTFPIIATYNAANGCKHADTMDVTVMPLPTVAFTVAAVTCEKSSISFTDNSTPNSSSIQSWGWNFGDASANASSQNTAHTYASANSYVVTLTVTNSNNCTASLPKTVVVHSRPLASFTMPASVCLPDGNAAFTNQSTVADDANLSYAWNFGDPNNATGSTIKDPTHQYSSVGPFNVQLTVTSQYGCVKDSTRIFWDVHPEPVAGIIATPKDVCIGDPIQFTGQTQNAVTALMWTFGDTQTDNANQVTTHNYTNANTYNVTFYYNDGFGCKSNTATETVTVNPYPVMDAGPTVYVLQGYAAQLQATATGSNLTYLWTPSLYLNDSSLLKPYSMPLADQFYTLKVTNAGGCFTTDTMTVKLLKEPEVPNAFSPNGDGINDTWQIGQLSYYFGCTVEVFNRGGQKLFNSVGYQNAWDGTHNGKPLPVGTYYYIINPKNGHPVISGHVTILR
jgi:gliding motility-associated-like protein